MHILVLGRGGRRGEGEGGGNNSAVITTTHPRSGMDGGAPAAGWVGSSRNERDVNCLAIGRGGMICSRMGKSLPTRFGHIG